MMKSKSTELEKEIIISKISLTQLGLKIRDFEEAAFDLKSQVSGLKSDMQARMAEIDMHSRERGRRKKTVRRHGGKTKNEAKYACILYYDQIGFAFV
jgi:hypothetical protein